MQHNNINLNQNDFGVLAICAIRYCFNRRTYMPNLIQEIVLKNINKISTPDLKIIKRDMDWVFQDEHLFSNGHLHDKPGWQRFQQDINKELTTRI